VADVTSAVVEEDLDPGRAVERVSHPSCGGIAVFVGTVRKTAAAPEGSDKNVVALEYEAHPSLAAERLHEVASEAARRWDLTKVVTEHRIGRCDLGAPTVVVACAAPHRQAALDACRWIIDTIKVSVPIWKKEIYKDGSAWIGTGS
jgi:molybdopterin synthase catalytic subunit